MPGSLRKRKRGVGFYEVRSPKSEVRREAKSARPALAELRFGHGDIDFSRVHQGDHLWKTSDPELERRLRQTFEGTGQVPPPPVGRGARVDGQPLTLIARDELGKVAQGHPSIPLTRAEKTAAHNGQIARSVGRLGGTIFRLEKFENLLRGDLRLPVSELNRLRREVVAELERLRSRPLAMDRHRLTRAQGLQGRDFIVEPAAATKRRRN